MKNRINQCLPLNYMLPKFIQAFYQYNPYKIIIKDLS